MLNDFTDYTTVATANNQYLFRIRVGMECRVSCHFMIHELVFYRRHNHTVKDQHITEFFGLYHSQILKVCLLCNISLLNLRGDPEYRGLFLRKP
ncbi:hypothetical protein D3C73_1516790 [compost metagenome]